MDSKLNDSSVEAPPRADAAPTSAPELTSTPSNKTSEGSRPEASDAPAVPDTQPGEITPLLKSEIDVGASYDAVPPTTSPVHPTGDIGKPTATPVKQDAAPEEAVPESDALEAAVINGAPAPHGSSDDAAPEIFAAEVKGKELAASVQEMAAQPEEAPGESVEVTPQNSAAEVKDAPAKKGKAKRKKKAANSSAPEKPATAAAPKDESPAAVEEEVVVLDPPAEVVLVPDTAAESKAAPSATTPTTPRIPGAANTVSPPSTPLAKPSAAPSTPPATSSGGVRAVPEISSGTNSKGVALYPHDALREGCTWPADVDPVCREQHLADDDFAAVMGTTKDVFATLPAWRQLGMKKKAGLF